MVEKKPPKKAHTMLANGVTYTLTVNMAEQKFKTNSVNRPRILVNQYVDYLHENFSNWCEYEVRPEISSKGRWHYHGTVKVLDSFLYHLIYAHKILEDSMIEIDTIDDNEKWDKYIRKDEAIMEPALKKMGIPYVINNMTHKPHEKKKGGIHRFLESESE